MHPHDIHQSFLSEIHPSLADQMFLTLQTGFCSMEEFRNVDIIASKGHKELCILDI